MRQTLELPRLSLAERDRRWAAVRKEMAARQTIAARMLHGLSFQTHPMSPHVWLRIRRTG